METDIEKKKKALLAAHEIRKSGFAGVIGSGSREDPIRVVDRRHYPDAVPMMENKALDIPAPRTVEVIDCPNCYGGHQAPCHVCGDSGRVVNIPNTDYTNPVSLSKSATRVESGGR